MKYRRRCVKFRQVVCEVPLSGWLVRLFKGEEEMCSDEESPKEISDGYRSKLLPERHPQKDFFIADVFDAAPKSDTASMAYPLFTLSTKPDFQVKEFRQGDKWLKISPSASGLATVHDRDLLIFCISQCMAKLNKGEPIAKAIRFKAKDMLVATNRATNGKGYELLKATFRRLQGTQIETNITTGGTEQFEVFSLVDKAKIIREGRDGPMHEVEIVLSDWVFSAIREKGGEILTISRDYFRLRKPLERRLYELARKHCGSNPKWTFSIETLHERSGSMSSPKEFRRMLRTIIDDQEHMPDYSFELVGKNVFIRPRADLSSKLNRSAASPSPSPVAAMDNVRISLQTIERVSIKYPEHDVYGIEADWRAMLESKGQAPDNPDGSFTAYAKWYANKPMTKAELRKHISSDESL